MQREYNGWTNYETWLVNLHFGNEPGINAETHSIVLEHQLDNGDAANALKEWTHGFAIGDEDQHPFITDLLRSALAEVNWHEIAKHMHEEATSD